MSYFYAPTYEEGLESRGFEILEWVTFGSYQGDYAVILKKDGVFGFGVIGYGSCSGCDSLYACDSDKEFQELLDRVISFIDFGTTTDLISKINNEFDDNNWFRHDRDFEENKSKLIQALMKGEQ